MIYVILLMKMSSRRLLPARLQERWAHAGQASGGTRCRCGQALAPLKLVAGAIDVELLCKSWESDNGRRYLLQPWELPGSRKPNAGGGAGRHDD